MLRRLTIACAAGFLAGWAAGALESAWLIGSLGFLFPSPLASSVDLAFHYALFGAVLGMFASVVPRKIRARNFSSSGAAVFFALIALIGLSWVNQDLFPERSFLAPWALLADLCLLGLCVAGAYGLGRIRGFPVALLLFALAGHVGTVVTAPEAPANRISPRGEAIPKAPNFVVLLVDTLRADHLGCYGYDKPTSPNIDALAATGRLFRAAYSQASWTRPSVASLMTSLYPASHGANDLTLPLAQSLTTLPETLSAAGYRTAGFSANRNVSPTFGFDQGFQFFWTHNMSAQNRLLNFSSGMKLLGGVAKKLGLGLSLREGARPKNDARTVTDQVLSWADQERTGAQGDPYFLYVQYIDPHIPYDPPHDYLEEIGLPGFAPERSDRIAHFHKVIPYPFGKSDPVPDDIVAEAKTYYDAEISFCDRELGRLLDGLRDRGMLENTYVILTADHGEEFYDHQEFLHGQSMFQELINVPLVIEGPGIQPGIEKTPVELVDLFPTLVELAGAKVLAPLQGHDLTPLLHPRGSEGGFDFREAFSNNIKHWELASLISGTDKLIRVTVEGEVKWMLFDLVADPGELHDLSAERPQRLAELRQELEKRRQESARFQVRDLHEVSIEGVRSELQSLGYVGGDEDQ